MGVIVDDLGELFAWDAHGMRHPSTRLIPFLLHPLHLLLRELLIRHKEEVTRYPEHYAVITKIGTTRQRSYVKPVKQISYQHLA